MISFLLYKLIRVRTCPVILRRQQRFYLTIYIFKPEIKQLSIQLTLLEQYHLKILR